MLDAAVDAFVLYSLPDGHPLVEAVLRRRVPVVVQSGPQLRRVTRSWRSTSARPAAAAAEHLRALGHTRLAVLSLPFSLADRADRPLRRRASRSHRVTRGRLAGLRRRPSGARSQLNDRAHGEAAAGVLLDGPEPPTGLLCMSDELAIGALRAAAAARGIAVPGQLSVVGWDDTPEAARAGPLTTIRQSLRDQGRLCAELIAEGADRPGRAAAVGVGRQEYDRRLWRSPCVRASMGTPASADIDVGSRVITTQPLPEGIPAGARGTVVGAAGLDPAPLAGASSTTARASPCPEYALDPDASLGRFARG